MNRYLLILGITLITIQVQAQTAVLNVADSLFATGNYSKAIERYQTYDQPADVYEKIAKSYMALGNYDEAILNYDKALKVHPEAVLLKFEYAKVLYNVKKFKTSALLFEELVTSDDKNPNYQYELGQTKEALRDSTAIEFYTKAFELDSTHQKSIYKIARKLLVERKHDASLKHIEIGLSAYANNVELISLKAQNYYWMQDYRESARWFERLIELGETSQFIHESLSFCYAKHFDYKKAVEQGLIVLQYDPKNFKNLFIQGQLYQGLENFEKAAEYMALALELRDIPLDDEYTRLGYVLNRQGKHKEAIEALQKSIKINPNNFQSQFYMLMAKDRYYEDIDTRIKLYEDFIVKHPKSANDFWIEKRIKELKEEKFMKGED
ncbi:MAG: tetratricopeptide repeat protein [Aquaticitalea sp.]